MRSFNDARFANALNRICAATNANLRRNQWTAGGLVWSRERHSYQRAEWSFQCETHLLKHAGWVFLYVNESWRDADGGPMRSVAWGRLLSGKKADALAWFRHQEALLEKQAAKTA